MCAIVGIVARSPVNQALYDALTVLQHRGQDAAGIVTWDGERLSQRKDTGLVRDVFEDRHMLVLKGTMGIGHARYPTAGRDSQAEAQPFYVNSPYGITLAHNGNLVNADALKQEVYRQDLRHVNTDSDSEILLNVFAHELHKQGRLRVEAKDVFAAVAGVHARCRGGYAAVGMINGYGVFAFRDPHAIRPVCFGWREAAAGPEYMVASESAALDVLGFELIRDLDPGEAIYIDALGKVSCQQCAEAPVHAPCIFEYVYLARPDSVIDDVSVYKARLRLGEHLADKILREWPDHDIDVVIRFPRPAAPRACRCSTSSGSSTARVSSRIATSGAPSSCRARRSGRARCAASSTRSTSSSKARTCFSWTTPSCAAPPPPGSSGWRATRGREGSTSRPPRPGALPERLRHRHTGRERADRP